jgi:hypothetical protein
MWDLTMEFYFLTAPLSTGIPSLDSDLGSPYSESTAPSEFHTLAIEMLRLSLV